MKHQVISDSPKKILNDCHCAQAEKEFLQKMPFITPSQKRLKPQACTQFHWHLLCFLTELGVLATGWALMAAALKPKYPYNGSAGHITSADNWV